MTFPDARRGVLPCLLAALCASCTTPDLTEAEEDRLMLLTAAQAEVQPSPTNAVADDPNAAILGEALFFDDRLSGPLLDDSSFGNAGDMSRVSCATCHDLGVAGTDSRSALSVSRGTGLTRRNSPSNVNLRFTPYPALMNWDGRVDSVWAQAMGPLVTETEMNSSLLRTCNVVSSQYGPEYEAIFGSLPPLDDRSRFPDPATLCTDARCAGSPGDSVWQGLSVGDRDAVEQCVVNTVKAIEAFQRTVDASDSPFDRYMAGESPPNFGPDALRGAKLFVGRASCDECHSGSMFTDYGFHNLGVPPGSEEQSVTGPGWFAGQGLLLESPYNAASVFSDSDDTAHLDGLEPAPGDLGAYKTPSLRNVSRSAPYMHNGSIDTMWDVLEFYRFGGGNDGLVGEKDSAIRPLLLTDDDLHDLVAFLKSLESDPVFLGGE